MAFVGTDIDLCAGRRAWASEAVERRHAIATAPRRAIVDPHASAREPVVVRGGVEIGSSTEDLGDDERR